MSKKIIKIMKIISNITFILAIVLGAYIFIDTIMLTRSLPPGTCPVNDNRTLIYITIGLALTSVISSFFDKAKS